MLSKIFALSIALNSSGILRNISSAGDYGRKKLRECEGLVDSVLYLVKKAIEKANIDNKSVENCVCVLRNLSYRAQEVDDPNYDKVSNISEWSVADWHCNFTKKFIWSR